MSNTFRSGHQGHLLHRLSGMQLQQEGRDSALRKIASQEEHLQVEEAQGREDTQETYGYLGHRLNTCILNKV